MPLLETPPNPAPTNGEQTPPNTPQPIKVSSRRFGELEEHELIRLLDTFDDEIARARFRESIYVSVIFCLAVAWFAFYGPRVLFHEGHIANPHAEVAKLQDKEMKFLDLPKALVHKPPPQTKTISDQDRIKQTPHPVPEVKPPQPAAGAPAPVQRPQPPAPQPQHQAAPQPQQPPAPQPQQQPKPPQNSNIPDAPRPATPSHSTFGGAQSPGQSLRDAAAAAARGGGGGNYGTSGPSAHNGPDGVEILSDTLGVDFGPYIKRLLRILYNAWVPLIPEETRPPLNKEGSTLIRFTINPDGNLAVGGMHLDASTHDQAIDRAAWGSITSVGQFPPLPKNFNGPNLQLRVHFIIAHDAPKNDF
jgi:outer membrane biosynthesis protein TonB